MGLSRGAIAAIIIAVLLIIVGASIGIDQAMKNKKKTDSKVTV